MELSYTQFLKRSNDSDLVSNVNICKESSLMLPACLFVLSKLDEEAHLSNCYLHISSVYSSDYHEYWKFVKNIFF